MLDGSEDNTIVAAPDTWPNLWGTIMKDIAADIPSRNHVIVDILNEPDHAGLTWEFVRPFFSFGTTQISKA